MENTTIQSNKKDHAVITLSSQFSVSTFDIKVDAGGLIISVTYARAKTPDQNEDVSIGTVAINKHTLRVDSF